MDDMLLPPVRSTARTTWPGGGGSGRLLRAAGAVPLRGVLLLTLLFVGTACSPVGRFISPLDTEGVAPPADSLRAFTVYLIGDAGSPRVEGTEPTLQLLKHRLDREGRGSAVVFLGDNIYPSGLPPTLSPGRAEAERRLMAQIRAVQDFAGEVVFIPGNHDWGNQGLGGDPQALLRQERFVESALNRGNTFLPDNGFPGPVEVPLTDRLTLVVLDTQWWVENIKTFGDTGQYQLEQEGSVLIVLDDVLKRHAGKDVLVVGHHPMYTSGEHGGFFEDELLPLALTRRYLGTPQDLSNLKYRRMRKGLLAVFRQHDDLIYAAGHDHNLQYFRTEGQHFIVSGSGSKTSHVARGRGEAFASERQGFGVVDYYRDGSVWLTFWAPVEEGDTGEMLYRALLKKASEPLLAAQAPPAAETPPSPPGGTEHPPAPDGPDRHTAAAQEQVPAQEPHAFFRAAAQAPYAFFTRGTVTVAAAERYRTGWLGELLLGEHYRDIWTAPVEAPIIDLERTAGGLTPIKKGGGFQTRSLRLQGADGDEYVLRSIDKNPVLTVPEYLRRTIVQDVVQDQISAMLPYGAFVLPPLAEAAGIFHTYPLLVYVPDDERLGLYRDEFGGMLALFESRPDEDQSDEARFGHAENIVGWRRMEERVTDDNDDRVDERALARARLFDMLIGDWDRHHDQWRWAEFEDEHGRLFKPVPRDRDFAFFKFDGPLAALTRFTGDPAFRRLTNFRPAFGDLLGLNYNGAILDRRYTSRLTRSDWIEVAADLQRSLTDEAIEEAIRLLPAPVYDRVGAFLTASLKARRNALPEAAERYYKLLARIVDVVGSDKHERFEVKRLNDDEVEVVVYKTLKEGDLVRELYRRTFKRSETKEIRLYGLAGNDQFMFEGEVNRSIRVRAIGGEEEDVFLDQSSVKQGRRKTILYDTEEGNQWSVGREARALRSNEPGHNTYVPLRFQLPTVAPVSFFGWNVDDGLFLGGGTRITTYGFRKVPFAASHLLAANVSVRTEAVNARYHGIYTSLVRDWDTHLDANLIAIRNFRNFYGLGNETEGSEAVRESYQARIGRVLIAPSLSRSVMPFTTVHFGPRFEYTNVEPPAGWTEDDPRSAFRPEDFDDKYFVGAVAALHIDGTDTLAVTETGARWLNEVGLHAGVRPTDQVFATLSSELSYFYTFDLPTTVTLALRAGGAANVGDFAFYQASMLGGQTNLRGFRKHRFAGRSSFYTNAELRVSLFDFNAYLTRGKAGIFVFFDNGRVWADRERSGRWHQGYGGGFWFTPFYKTAVTATLGRSTEDVLFNLGLGFLF